MKKCIGGHRLFELRLICHMRNVGDHTMVGDMTVTEYYATRPWMLTFVFSVVAICYIWMDSDPHVLAYEPHEKTRFLYMRKQRRRSAV